MLLTYAMERISRHTPPRKATSRASAKPARKTARAEFSPTDAVLARIANERLALLFRAGAAFGYGPEYADIVVDNFFDQLKRHEYDRARRLYIDRRDRIIEHGEIPRAEAEAAFDEMRGNVRRFKPRLRTALAEIVAPASKAKARRKGAAG